jgi:undecaprenyl-diphosphatase
MTDRPERSIRVRERPATRTVVVVCLVGVAVVVVTALAARDGSVAPIEADVLLWINGWPDSLEPGMWAIQQFGMLFATVAVGAAAAVAGRRWTLAIPFVLIIPVKLVLERAVIKYLVDRQRPFVSYGPEIIVRGGNYDGLSYPSGHALTAFAVAILLFALLPGRWRAIPIVWAVLVGVARLYMGEHNFYDVVAGAAIGVVLGVVLWYLVLAHPAIAGEPPDTARGALGSDGVRSERRTVGD